MKREARKRTCVDGYFQLRRGIILRTRRVFRVLFRESGWQVTNDGDGDGDDIGPR